MTAATNCDMRSGCSEGWHAGCKCYDSGLSLSTLSGHCVRHRKYSGVTHGRTAANGQIHLPPYGGLSQYSALCTGCILPGCCLTSHPLCRLVSHMTFVKAFSREFTLRLFTRPTTKRQTRQQVDHHLARLQLQPTKLHMQWLRRTAARMQVQCTTSSLSNCPSGRLTVVSFGDSCSKVTRRHPAAGQSVTASPPGPRSTWAPAVASRCLHTSHCQIRQGFASCQYSRTDAYCICCPSGYRY